MYDFNYLIDRLNQSDICQEPFEYIYIEKFLSDKHFKDLIAADDISVNGKDDQDLIQNLENQGYEALDFPGCTPSKNKYIKFRKINKPRKSIYEGLGFAMRLANPKDQIVAELKEFFSSDQWRDAVKEKFNISEDVSIDAGLQKYLSDYQITPHPDIRAKAATWMLNVNNMENSENADIHTHILKFKKPYEYIYKFWEGNPVVDRAWVPWEWCNTVKKFSKNNSILLFSPSNRSLHAVSLKYDHLETQRTQFYGNLWFIDSSGKELYYAKFDELDLKAKIIKNVKPYVKKRNHDVTKGRLGKIFGNK